MGELKEKVDLMAEKESIAISKAAEIFEDSNRTLKKKKPLELAAEWAWMIVNVVIQFINQKIN